MKVVVTPRAREQTAQVSPTMTPMLFPSRSGCQEGGHEPATPIPRTLPS